MKPGKFAATLLLALNLSAISINSYSQKVISTRPDITLSENKDHRGITKPKEKADITVDVFVQKQKDSEYKDSLHVGELEVRANSMYASLLYGYYQVFFEQKNDSTFLEHVYSKSLLGFTDRYELFTTKRRKDSDNNYYLVMTKYETLRGKKRKEKIPLENKSFDSKYITPLTALQQFLKDSLPGEINICLLGEPYTIKQHEETLQRKQSGNLEERKVIKYAKMSEVTSNEYNTFLMKDFFNVYATIEEKLNEDFAKTVIPEKFEAKFVVLKTFLNGEYRGLGVVRK